jgi:signal transduction histidine kinase
VQELQEERMLSTGYLLNLVQAPDLINQSAKARDRLAALTRFDQPLSAQMSGAIANASRLDDTRAQVLNRAQRPDLLVAEFTGVITPIIDALDLRHKADLTTAVGRQVFALDQALRTDDQISQASSYLTTAAVTQNTAFVGLFYSILVNLQSDIVGGQIYFTPTQYKLYLAAQEAVTSRVGPDFLTRAAVDPSAAVRLLDTKTIFTSLQSVNVLGGFTEKRIASDVNRATTTSRNDALRIAIIVGAMALLLLLLVISLSIVVARAVARPLRRLTSSAERVARAAEVELERVADDDAETARPIYLDPVDVAARDEIGDLARAFDRVQGTAARLVERQVLSRRNVAQMFAHVGRRTQNLVGRQLALIDDLERRETESERLRELYRLDHMSSRLRRNASSLVVLSGGAGADEHMSPLPLSDVVRLALGEIEDYTRVDVDIPEDIVVVPSVVADLTLLLAELMENATSFSPPHTRVRVTATDFRGGARLAVVDQGLGLTPDRLAEENARLTRRERLDLAPSEVLGLFVVGRLARRHDIEVTLTDTPEGGLTAWVDLNSAHLRAPAETVATAKPIQHTGPVMTASRSRSAPVSARPFDANVFDRATRTLQSAPSWNAFIPVRPVAPELEAAPAAEPRRAYDAGAPVAEPRPAYDAGTPVAGRAPVVLPEPAVEVESPVVTGPIVMSAPPDAIQLPRQRPGDRRRSADSPLRRRVPGTQLPADTGTRLPSPAPSADDAEAARAAVEAFEDGVSRAQWAELTETDAGMSSPAGAAHRPLLRRTPGATLPLTEPVNPEPPASPSTPLDPDEARALVEQFEYGVALALRETQPQHEGQPR